MLLRELLIFFFVWVCLKHLLHRDTQAALGLETRNFQVFVLYNVTIHFALVLFLCSVTQLLQVLNLEEKHRTESPRSVSQRRRSPEHESLGAIGQF